MTTQSSRWVITLIAVRILARFWTLCSNLARSHHLVPLRGNHEIMMLDSRQKKSWFHAWMKYGGDATLLSYSPSEDEAGSFADVPDSHIDFLKNNLVSYYECERYFFRPRERRCKGRVRPAVRRFALLEEVCQSRTALLRKNHDLRSHSPTNWTTCR